MSTSALLILGLAMSLIAPATNPGSPPSTVERRGVADVYVVVAERRLVSVVGGSENGGRMLIHGAVARSLTPLGDLPERDRTLAAIVDVAVARTWKFRHLQIVGVIQERDSRRIPGAGAVKPSFRPGSDQ
jgi:hypothetical protein